MKIQRIVVGDLEENCYLLVCDGQALLIDPGDCFWKIQKEIEDLKLLKVLITHDHFDHVGSLLDVLNCYHVEALCFHDLEEKEYQIGPFQFRVIFTPGHSSDSVSYYFFGDHVMFVGDFVFAGTIGRCDLPTGDFSKMKESIQKISVYPKDIVLYPGHGERTTIGEEMQKNPYFR